MALSTTELARKLSEASVKSYESPYGRFAFPDRLDPNEWQVAPELISLYGQPEWEKLTEEQRKKLSFHEAVNFCSLNIHGEKALIEGLAHRLYTTGDAEHSRYIHHFLDEENKHMVLFGTFCMKYAGKIYEDRKLNFPREYLPGEEDFLFFLKVFLFEEIVDYYNVKMSKDPRLSEISRNINDSHHFDETRHLSYGKAVLVDLFQQHSAAWGEERVAQIRDYITSYATATFREYYNPDVYADAGLADPYDLAERAFQSEVARKHRQAVLANAFRYLLKNGVIKEEPAL